MEYIDITKYVKSHRVLNFDFSTIMLFRCTKRKYAEDFIKGKIHFNQPKNWIKEEENGNKGRGDCTEGSCITVESNDHSRFVKSLKENKEYKYIQDGKYIFFRRKNIENVYCLCLYSLNNNSFTHKEVEVNGKAHYRSIVSNEYFTDFSDNVNEEMYQNMDSAEQPVVIFMSNPHEFFEKIRAFFRKLGIEENEIIISPVEYLNKKCVTMSALPYPHELLLKDEYYRKQSEIRIIINSQNPKLLEYMAKNNNTIDIGSIESFANIYDYYFKDLLIERQERTL